MTYPEAVDRFVEKLNKADTVYVIEDEELVLEDGVFEGELAHDNVKNESVMVFTGPKMSGERIENFFLSIPSNAPWKRIIKVFANAPKVYVTYETTGDQVEAEDINRVQESIVNTQKEVERYKAANDQAVSDLGTRLSTVESKKADKTYVDTELLKKADKENIYTKAETDSRIQAIIGAAPEALDTLAEIAEALNNDPDFAATITNMLAQKVDKVAGMGLSEANFTNEEKTKLSSIEEGANKYIHPSTHPASMIVESTDKQFVSATDKAKWDAKETPEGAQEKANAAETNAKTYADNKIDDLAGAGRTTETVKEVADDLVSHKANTANPHNVTKSQVGLANVDNVQQASKTEFTAHVNDTIKHVTSAERTAWNNKAEISDIPTKVSQLENDAEYVTQIELERYKSVNDQAVDNLDSRLTTVENNKAEKSYVDSEFSKKADKTYVDIELEKKANKSDTYTKSETNSLIQALIDSAPETLNTLAKIANAINNDPNFATTINNLLAQLEANKLDKSLKGVAGGLAELDSTGRVPSSQLPSYVDDVLEYPSKNNFPAVGETGKIYIALDTNLAYRWSGSSYVEISPSLALGETSSTAYRGDRGKIAYDHSLTIGNPHQTTKADIGLGNVENYGIATQAEAEAGSVNNKYMTPLRVKQAIDVLQAVKSVAGKTGHVTLTKDDVGLSNVDNVKQASKTEFDSHNNDTTRHITAEERTRWNNKAEVSQIPTKVSELENDVNFVTQEELGNAGYGDMVKSVYDTDNDGKVDMAEAADSVPWDGVIGKPGTFPPSSHNHDDRYIKNTGGTIQNGDLYMDGGSVNYVRPDTTGGWARGFWWSKRDLTRIGGIGVLGSGETISKFYIGYGISPWANSIVEIYPSYINVNGEIKQQGQTVLLKGQPLTWNNLKGE